MGSLTKKEKKGIYVMSLILIIFSALLSYEFATGNGLTNGLKHSFLINFVIAAVIMISVAWIEVWYVIRH